MHAYSYADSLSKIEHVTFVGIYDEKEERGKDAADIYKVPFFNSLENFLEQKMDAVVITSENTRHYYYIKQAASYNKNILCEKPLATTEEEARLIIKTCEEKNVTLRTAFPVRYATPIIQAKESIDNGDLGRILAVKATNRGKNPGGWFVDKSLSGGGAVIDHTVHVVDILRWIMQAEVKEVYGEIDTKFIDEDIDDTGIITMDFNNGTFASLDCSWSRVEEYPYKVDLTMNLIGSKRNMKIDVFSQGIFVYSSEDGINSKFFGDDMNKEMINDFSLSSISLATGNDGLKALEVALAAYKSSNTGEAVNI